MMQALSATNPVGPQAERLTEITWFLTWLSVAVSALVIGALFYALWRGAHRTENASGSAVERKMAMWVGGGIGATTLILLGILVYNLITGRALAAFADPTAMTIKVRGHQWWWEIEYRDPLPNRRLVTANEIHLPVGRKVRLELASRDVIHSFWAPNIQGKIDLVPGYSSSTYIQVDKPGTYHGRCAEFCGLQHAHMDFFIIAHTPAEFAKWYEAQLKPAPEPADTVQQKGKNIFLTRTCAMCHGIRGTPADSRIGPDLTHIGSRATLGAGTIPNTRGHLAGWIMDPQRIKPGVLMPPNQLTSDELQSLVSYLESLK